MENDEEKREPKMYTKRDLQKWTLKYKLCEEAFNIFTAKNVNNHTSEKQWCKERKILHAHPFLLCPKESLCK